LRTADNLLDLIGHTPLVKLNRCIPESSPHEFYAKLEFMNPGGSVKDRMARNIIEDAEKRGLLKSGGTIIEATSGNTGVGLAMVASIKGYKCIFTISEKMSDEKINTLKTLGATVIVTPKGVEPEDSRSVYSVAEKLAKEIPNSYLTNQYHNSANPEAHYKTTGPEIWEQMNGKIDLFVDGAGTGGTISGTGRFLKEKNPDVKIVCADPVGSILYDLFYHKEIKQPPAPFLVEGIGEDMLPKNVQMDVLDDFVQVSDRDTFQTTLEIVKKEGVFAGPSSGCALSAAIQYSKRWTQKKRIVVIFPDSGSKYLSKIGNSQWLFENGIFDQENPERRFSHLENQLTKMNVPSEGLPKVAREDLATVALLKSIDSEYFVVEGSQKDFNVYSTKELMRSLN